MNVECTWDGLPFRTLNFGGKTVLVPMRVEVKILGLPWLVGFTIDNSGSEPAITALRVEQADGGEPITANMLRGVRLGEALQQALDRLSWPVTYDDAGMIVWPSSADELYSPGIGANLTKLRRRHTITDADMRRTAALHAQAALEGRSDILMYLAEHLHVSRATAARWRDRARKLGFITEEGHQLDVIRT